MTEKRDEAKKVAARVGESQELRERMKRTPGPWFITGARVKLAGQQWHAICHYDEEKKRDVNIALVWYDPETGDGFGDAHLVASAPVFAQNAAAAEARVANLLADLELARAQQYLAETERDTVLKREAATIERYDRRIDAAEAEVRKLRAALLGYIRNENGCSPVTPYHATHCTGWDAEKCGCAVEARAALTGENP